MSRSEPSRQMFQRNALAPSLIAAVILFVAPALMESEWFLAVRFVTAIFALIVGWFAVQAKQWWWAPLFAAVAVIWNPIYPFAFDGPVWIAAQPAAALLFLAAGAFIKAPRPS